MGRILLKDKAIRATRFGIQVVRVPGFMRTLAETVMSRKEEAGRARDLSVEEGNLNPH